MSPAREYRIVSAGLLRSVKTAVLAVTDGEASFSPSVARWPDIAIRTRSKGSYYQRLSLLAE